MSYVRTCTFLLGESLDKDSLVEGISALVLASLLRLRLWVKKGLFGSSSRDVPLKFLCGPCLPMLIAFKMNSFFASPVALYIDHPPLFDLPNAVHILIQI